MRGEWRRGTTRAVADQPHRLPRARRLLQRGFHRRSPQRRRARGGGRGGGHLRADPRSAEAGLGGTTTGVPRVQQAR